MAELWVTLVAAGAWALAAGSVGFVGSFIVQRLRHRQAARRLAEDRAGASGVERAATTDSGPAPAPAPALVLVRTSGPASADRDLVAATSTAA